MAIERKRERAEKGRGRGRGMGHHLVMWNAFTISLQSTYAFASSIRINSLPLRQVDKTRISMQINGQEGARRGVTDGGGGGRVKSSETCEQR